MRSDLRHDPRQMEDLGGEVSHVAVEEDEQGLDDSGVQGEAGREGTENAVDGAHHDASQRNHKETDHAEKRVDHGHPLRVGKLLEQVIQNLRREQHMILSIEICLDATWTRYIEYYTTCVSVLLQHKSSSETV